MAVAIDVELAFAVALAVSHAVAVAVADDRRCLIVRERRSSFFIDPRTFAPK